MFVAINMTLPHRVWDVLDESFCVTPETTASGGWSERAKNTFHLSLASSFSKAAVLQLLNGHMNSAEGFVIEM